MANETYNGYKIHLLYDLPTLVPICSVVTPANVHDHARMLPLLRKMGANALLINGLFDDITYDSRTHGTVVPDGQTMINQVNQKNTKKELHKYRLQEYIPFHDITMKKLYKNRMHCEYANYH